MRQSGTVNDYSQGWPKQQDPRAVDMEDPPAVDLSTLVAVKQNRRLRPGNVRPQERLEKIVNYNECSVCEITRAITYFPCLLSWIL